MHLHTIVKVWAEDEDQAISKVNDLLTDDGEYRSLGAHFDYVSEEETKVSEDIKTEEDFQKLREEEIRAYQFNLDNANKLPMDSNMKGYYLRSAGEALDRGVFWSIERQAYIMDWDDDYDNPELSIFYIDTDRHA